MDRYEQKERVWRKFPNWEMVKDYIDKVQKVIEIDGVSKVFIEFHNYQSKDIDNWSVSVELVKG